MKRFGKRIAALSTVLAICMSMGFTVHADAYDHIGFDYMPSVYSANTTQQLSITAYDSNGDEVAFSGDVKYSSSNEKVVSVSGSGLMTMENYGVATVTAVSGNLEASMLITVRHSSVNIAEGGVAPSSHSTDHVRTGEFSYKLQGGTDTSFSDGSYAKINSLLHQGGTIPANATIEAWFYDNGSTTDSEAGIYMSPYSNNANGARLVGIINASDTNYKVSGRGSRLSQTGGNWNQGNKYGIRTDVVGTNEDTGISRKKGWHQVTYVRKNANASQTLADGGLGNLQKSAIYDLYLDGQKVYTETADRTFVYLYGYAGFNSSNYAYIADPKINQYIEVTDVALSEASGTYTVNYSNYYGKSGDQTIRYNWQVSDDGVTGWTVIPGATSLTTSSYTPNATTYANKYIRGGVRVIAGGVYPNYYYDKAYVWDGTYTNISLGKNTTAYSKGASNQQLDLVGYAMDKSEHGIADLTGATFTSSDESIVTVTDAGLLTAVDYGVATVTATYGGLTASMLVTVTNNTINAAEGGAAPGSHSTERVRCGAYSYKLQGGTDTSFSDGTYAKINSLVHQWNGIPANAVAEAWFYDNGNSTDSEAGLYFSAYSAYANGTRVVGIINASDTTYKVTQKGARLSQTNNNWNQGNKYGVRSDVVSTPTDTGIARTPGWHQVTFVRKNTDASATVSDKGNSFPKSTSYDIYLDGQKVFSETTDQAFVYMYGYAGFNSSNYAYIADPAICQYIGVEDVELSEANNTFTINNHYYGTAGAQTATYKWQISDNGETGWTDISGATAQTYTPTAAQKNKHIRGAVAVSTSGAFTGYRYTGEAVPNFSLISASGDSAQINVRLKINNDTVSAVPYALLIGYYNAEGRFIESGMDIGNVAAGSSKTEHTFTVPESIRNNYVEARVFLWDDLANISPYTQYIIVE